MLLMMGPRRNIDIRSLARLELPKLLILIEAGAKAHHHSIHHFYSCFFPQRRQRPPDLTMGKFSSANKNGGIVPIWAHIELAHFWTIRRDSVAAKFIYPFLWRRLTGIYKIKCKNAAIEGINVAPAYQTKYNYMSPRD